MMAQRNSDYDRVPRDAYQTPAWVTDVIVRELFRDGLLGVSGADVIWEPAAGAGQMVDALSRHPCARHVRVVASDIAPQRPDHAVYDFLSSAPLPFGSDMAGNMAGIITNPPYRDADAFVRRALEIIPANTTAFVAMLLPHAFDCAKGRRDLFAASARLRYKLTLTDRIVWFERPRVPGQPAPAGPSENHAWYVWGEHAYGSPELRWAGRPGAIDTAASALADAGEAA